ncbi:MAG: TIGR00645 family protein [Rhizobiales bacterium]|nr:TIGR00645 family protein [Hyphomicrobiales bacterium]
MKKFETLIENVLLGSRWLLVVFNLGLAAALALYAVSFVFKFIKVAQGVFVLDEAEMILAMLGLIDAALVASLLLMVMISSYENYVSRLDNVDVQLSWLGKLDAGSLKIKVASSIVAISSIHLLQVFLNASSYDNSKIMWFVILHLTFVVSALLLGVLDRITAKGDAHGKP